MGWLPISIAAILDVSGAWLRRLSTAWSVLTVVFCLMRPPPVVGSNSLALVVRVHTMGWMIIWSSNTCWWAVFNPYHTLFNGCQARVIFFSRAFLCPLRQVLPA